MTARRKRTPPKPLSPDDEWMEKVGQECVAALVGAMKELNTQRMIRSLTREELRVLVESVTVRWIVMASRRLKEQKPYPPVLIAWF